MYTLSGCGTLGQAAGSGPKVITMEQVAKELIKDLLDFSVPVLGVKLGSAVPDSIEGVLVNIAASALQKEFAEAIDVTKDEAHTDMVGFQLANEICNQMYNYGIIFNDDPDDSLQKKGDGLIWIMMVGDNWRSPGELSKFISNKLEDIVTELTGVEAEELPPEDFGFGDEQKVPFVPQFQLARPWETAGAGLEMEAGAEAGKLLQVGEKGTRVAGLPIVPLAIAGVAALLLLGRG